MSRHDGLRTFAGIKIAAERHAFDASITQRDFKFERSAGMPTPDFDRVDAVPVRALAASEQKVDCGRCRAANPLPTLPRLRGRVGRGRIAKRLAEIAALRMRLEIK